jgi:hypothetical protein
VKGDVQVTKKNTIAALIGLLACASAMAELPDQSILSRYGIASDQLPAGQKVIFQGAPSRIMGRSDPERCNEAAHDRKYKHRPISPAGP